MPYLKHIYLNVYTLHHTDTVTTVLNYYCVSSHGYCHYCVELLLRYITRISSLLCKIIIALHHPDIVTSG